MMSQRPASGGLLKLPVRSIFIAALIVLFGFLTFKAGKEGLADAFLRSAVRGAARPFVPGSLSQPDKWQQVRQDLNNSLRYSPLNPWTLEDAGRQDLRGLRARDDARPPKVAARSAYENFRLALTQRPTSPDAWANLALAKQFLGEQDEEMFEALRNADELGPWEFEIQHLVLSVSLSAWAKLDASQRAATLRTLGRAMRRNADKLAPMLVLSNRTDLLCDTGTDNPKVNALCSQLRKSAVARRSRSR